MTDIHKAYEILELANESIKLAKQYEVARSSAGKARADIDLLLTAHFNQIRSQKSNVGYDLAILMLIDIVPEAGEIYRTLQIQTAKYRGLEKIIDAYKTKISLQQSIMKYQLEGERGGL